MGISFQGTKLQRIESWEDVPLEFSGLSAGSIMVSAALRSCDPFFREGFQILHTFVRLLRKD